MTAYVFPLGASTSNSPLARMGDISYRRFATTKLPAAQTQTRTATEQVKKRVGTRTRRATPIQKSEKTTATPKANAMVEAEKETKTRMGMKEKMS